MTDEVREEAEVDDPASIVEGFLHALHSEDWDTAGAAMDENIVYDNVGYPTIHAR